MAFCVTRPYCKGWWPRHIPCTVLCFLLRVCAMKPAEVSASNSCNTLEFSQGGGSKAGAKLSRINDLLPHQAGSLRCGTLNASLLSKAICQNPDVAGSQSIFALLHCPCAIDCAVVGNRRDFANIPSKQQMCSPSPRWLGT
jgi:hypothetical protein